MRKFLLFISVTLIFINVSVGQETVGLVFDDINKNKSDGYTLYNPSSDQRVILINNCGEVVNQWDFTGEGIVTSYLLENGTILQSDRFNAEIRDWDNNVIWSINYEDVFGFNIHHDIEPLPNGNFLVLVRDSYTNTEMFAVGMDTAYPNDVLVLERIVEIEPVGSSGANVVWEWKIFDHLIQDFDSSKPKFGTIAENPQLLDMNYDGGHGSNPIHANAIDYNADLDQIAVSARHLSEVFVIDHSTTTAEAATNSGGVYDKGGDFLWRWGNPEVYDQGTELNKTLGKQHDIKWITEGPHQGKMSVFSNLGYGTDLTASSIHIIDQNDINGVYSMNSGKFLPESYFWSWDGIIMNEVMHGAAQCGVQIMSNGNALINESDIGRLTEVDNLGNIIWVYSIPIGNNTNFNQFDQPTGNGSFRAHRYPEDYSGLDGVTFNNTGIIEDVNSLSSNCAQRLSVATSFFDEIKVYPNPTPNVLNFNSRLDQIEVYDLTGKMVMTESDTESINLVNLESGLYLIKVSSGQNAETIKVNKI